MKTKLVSAVLSVALSTGTIGTVASSVTACTPAQQAEWTKVESTVLADLKAGKTLTQIEDDVAAIVLPGMPSADIVAIVNAAITTLLNYLAIPATNVVAAKGMLTELAAKQAAGQSAEEQRLAGTRSPPASRPRAQGKPSAMP